MGLSSSIHPEGSCDITPTSGQPDSFTTTLSSGLRYLGNGDQEYWSDSSTGQSPYQLDNGVLDINATYVGAGNTPGGGSLSYDSGVFTTQGMFSQQYGYFEMRAELPAGAGCDCCETDCAG